MIYHDPVYSPDQLVELRKCQSESIILSPLFFWSLSDSILVKQLHSIYFQEWKSLACKIDSDKCKSLVYERIDPLAYISVHAKVDKIIDSIHTFHCPDTHETPGCLHDYQGLCNYGGNKTSLLQICLSTLHSPASVTPLGLDVNHRAVYTRNVVGQSSYNMPSMEMAMLKKGGRSFQHGDMHIVFYSLDVEKQGRQESETHARLCSLLRSNYEYGGSNLKADCHVQFKHMVGRAPTTLEMRRYATVYNVNNARWPILCVEKDIKNYDYERFLAALNSFSSRLLNNDMLEELLGEKGLQWYLPIDPTQMNFQDESHTECDHKEKDDVHH